MSRILKIISGIAGKAGLEIRRSKKRESPTRLQAFEELISQIDGVDPSLTRYSTYKATELAVRSETPGDFVECGVFMGWQVMIMAATLLKMGSTDREIYLYDTFTGMTEPDENDFNTIRGSNPTDVHRHWHSAQTTAHNTWGYASIDHVKGNLAKTGYPMERFHFVQGDVMETIPNSDHERIALLRLDTDWYKSTKHELENLYPKVSTGGIIICDDYVAWGGARKAIDEYFRERVPSDHYVENLFHWAGGDKVFLKTKISRELRGSLEGSN